MWATATVNVTQAMALLDDVRDRLGALTVSATWETGHGDVQITCTENATPRMTVAGQDVPFKARLDDDG